MIKTLSEDPEIMIDTISTIAGLTTSDSLNTTDLGIVVTPVRLSDRTKPTAVAASETEGVATSV